MVEPTIIAEPSDDAARARVSSCRKSCLAFASVLTVSGPVTFIGPHCDGPPFGTVTLRVAKIAGKNWSGIREGMAK